jgi:RimJ/RimL family protein N-acetyltransferase
LKVYGNEVTFDADLVGPWVSAKTGGHWCKGRGTAIGRLKDGELVAGVLYEDFTKANIVCHIAGEEGWATKGFLGLIFDYPFNQLGVKRITAPVHSDNVKSRLLMDRLGFTLEATLAQAIPEGDLLIYRMFKSECRFLEDRFYGQAKCTSNP